MKKVFVSVSNDLVTDNRVDKTCRSLIKEGYEIMLIGRVKKDSPNMNERPYKYKRMRLIFEKGFLFYAELNLRLFFRLLFSKADVLWANDLDTLWANFLVSKIRNKALIFDSHEHFTEVPELKYNKFAKWFWKRSEGFMLPRIKNIITVCTPIAEYFKQNYNVDSLIVRNAPEKDFAKKTKSKEDLSMPNDKPILIWQGGGCNIERGMEELTEAMQWVDAYLYIIGGGDVFERLKEMAKEFKVEKKIFFISRLPFNEMMQYTFNADLGLSLDKDTNMNYSISLPNKLFEYIHAEIPILITPLSEIKPIVETFNIGDFITSHLPSNIALQINNLLENSQRRELYKANCHKAKELLCWQEEEKKIFDLIRDIK
ncbi:MAG: glycosyl transferase group 1 [Bacteroidetes bacterium]|nr:glycosyl transferase group 1 [Bacteroidota bacterium]